MDGRAHIYMALMIVMLNICKGEKILLFPFSQIFNSRTMNVEKIAILLRDNNHSVSMLVSDHYQPSRNIDSVHLIRYKMPEVWINQGGELDLTTALSYIDQPAIPLLRDTDIMEFTLCDALFGDQTLIQSLKQENFSLYFFDFVNFGPGIFLNEYLQVPSIAYSNYGFWNSWWVFHQPIFYSYMPFPLGSLSDHMTFWERIQNIYDHWEGMKWMNDKIEDLERKRWEYFPNEKWPHMRHAFERVSLVIAANVHFAFNYPCPVMPHVKPIPGLLWTPPQPLPQYYSDLVSWADHGIVLMSFGTLVPTMLEEKAELFARVFAKLPQKVLWRYKGTPPKSLGSNTHLVEWFPQNDLLAHPATRLFISHCGVSSTWEMLYHAVPVVAIPLLFDQHHHARILTDRAGVGVRLVFSTLTEDTLEMAIRSVLENKVFKENAVKLSELLKDTPMSGQDELLYWINYVIRHNGSSHFHSQAAYRLNWVQYFLLDVAALMAVLAFTVILAVVLMVVFVYKLSKSILPLLFKKKLKTA
ncbi:2-hydroxyacylsphingosine 1-beta-galactosyltransferase isoform X2 [Lingula anatina]|uniref:2-hydroxyacylsphingosine 1-beta-galactosyltransferase isoform X2 n=1 Tax=Lingula anatina TaxID=7574 RepID=A0A2R2MSL1_LINAN|nr:2-hydroxyacylsphingosine 1-beta-galactosyltransferase isoform X2 [Lingula anatina]|eukprot:XP_023933234.1 2-hydroxyacylsphingosine 1-beta-galactosyltransferase isoform X2 [Lingula anatina]